MYDQLLLIIQREIFNYMSTFVNDDIITPPHELLKLKETIQEAFQLLEEIKKKWSKTFPGETRTYSIMEKLITLKIKRLISNPRFETMFSSLIDEIDEYRYLITCSLCISVYGTL